MAKPPQTSTLKAPRIVSSKFKPPEMILIPQDEFIMGIHDEQIYRLVAREEWAIEWYEKDMFLVEQPQHIIELPAFEIGHYPVTNAEYHQFIWSTGYRVPRDWIGFHYLEGTGDHPVAGVSRQDALAYCKWLGQQTGQEYRLPTEAEWERAARGNDDRMYPWGEDFDPWRCNTLEGGKHGTTSVGEYSPSGDSPLGVADMAGNIYEWTSNRLHPYPYYSDDGREDLNGSGVCVIRGGAWYYSHKLARCTAREGVLPTFVSPALGFRLARTP
jgi:formylglycine-generating enzyme required for sulfatase activity